MPGVGLAKDCERSANGPSETEPLRILHYMNNTQFYQAPSQYTRVNYINILALGLNLHGI